MTYLMWLALAWLGYFLLHSALASLTVKTFVAEHWPQLMPKYRIGFNLVAVLLLLVPLGLMVNWRGPLILHWSGVWRWLAGALSLAALGLFAWSLKHYDMQEFLGMRQLREHETKVEDQERLNISPLHRFVRHPWYFLALILIWTRDMHAAQLLSSILMSGYFIYGSRLEEAKLLVYHGDVYQRYRERVAGIFPLPGKILSRREAQELASSK